MFRTISILEGLSYLVILSVTFGIIGREWVYSLGMAHGVLFLVYLVLSLVISGKKGWPVWGWFILLLASVIPFAFIPVEMYLRKIELADRQEVEALA